MRKINVAAGGKNYDVLIGSGAMDGPDIPELAARADRTGFVVSGRVMELHAELVTPALEGTRGRLFPMKDGEENKNYRYAGEFFNLLLKEGFSRRSLVVAVGGGVVGDFAGYCAAAFMRGIALVHVPTTLLAMVDSSIGGKVAVNVDAGKNIVGAFHQPSLVAADTRFLGTLPDSELKNGIAETVKHALIGETGLLDLLRGNTLDSIRAPEVMEELIFLSAGFKARVVGEDERETGLRAILNFGHTVGHAIESLLDYRGISHGEAVALGMKVELDISRRLGYLSAGETELFIELTRKYGLAQGQLRLDIAGVLDHMKYDKKNYGGTIRFALLKGLGNPVFDQEVDIGLLREALETL
jgi:3-dehydroquinate synthase